MGTPVRGQRSFQAQPRPRRMVPSKLRTQTRMQHCMQDCNCKHFSGTERAASSRLCFMSCLPRESGSHHRPTAGGDQITICHNLQHTSVTASLCCSRLRSASKTSSSRAADSCRSMTSFKASSLRRGAEAQGVQRHKGNGGQTGVALFAKPRCNDPMGGRKTSASLRAHARHLLSRRMFCVLRRQRHKKKRGRTLGLLHSLFLDAWTSKPCKC